MRTEITPHRIPDLDTVDAAAHIGLQPATLEIWRCRREGPPYLKVGRLVRYRLSDLDAWLDSRRVIPAVTE